MISSGEFADVCFILRLSTLPICCDGQFWPGKVSSGCREKWSCHLAFLRYFIVWYFTLMYGATGTISFTEMPAIPDGSPLQILAFVFLFWVRVVSFMDRWCIWRSACCRQLFYPVISKGSGCIHIAYSFIQVLPMYELWCILWCCASCHDDHRRLCLPLKTTKYRRFSRVLIHCTGRFYIGRFEQ